MLPAKFCCSMRTVSELAYSEHMHMLRFSESVTLILTVGVTRFFSGCASGLTSSAAFAMLDSMGLEEWGSITTVVWVELVTGEDALFTRNLQSNLRHSNKISQNSLLEYKHDVFGG